MNKKIIAAIFLLVTVIVSAVLLLLNKPRPALETKFAPASSSVPIASATQGIGYKNPPESVNLGSLNHTYQTFNNCGPATLSMALGWLGKNVSQKELGDKMRPWQVEDGDNDDKSIFTSEFVDWAHEYGFEALARPNGDIETLKRFTANGIPVVVKTYLHLNDDIGHFRIVKGFDEREQVIIQDDSFEGPNRRISYFDFLSLWQPFHYVYIIVYTPEQSELVNAILAEAAIEENSWESLITRSKKEAQLTPDSVYPIFNIAVASYYLGDYEKTVESFEKVEGRLPKRMLWYQLEPLLAYQKLGQHDKIFSISEKILNGGNRAYSELYQIRGEIYLAQGNRDAAREEYQKAVSYNVNYEAAKTALRDLQ